MARRPPDLKSQLGSFLRTTWQQLDSVRDVVVQKTREGRIQLDLTLLRRKRKEALSELGHVVARLARNGKIDEEKYPDLSGPLAQLEAIDERIEEEEQRARHAAQGIADSPMERYADEEYDEEPDAGERAGEDDELEEGTSDGDADDGEGPTSRARRRP